MNKEQKEKLEKELQQIDEAGLLRMLRLEAQKKHDGHFTVLSFTTNYRIGFGTPNDREDYGTVKPFVDFRAALIAAIVHEPTF